VTRILKIVPTMFILLTTVTLGAQNTPAPSVVASHPATPAPVSLKVSLVFSRYQGDKKISSVPHTLWVTANDQRTSLRMGTQVPIVNTVFSKDGEKPQSSYSYRDVGTNIDCNASSGPDGTYKLTLTIQDSSVYYPDQSDTAVRSTINATGAPAFRSFNSTFTLLLRDGQTAQSTSATDPVSGQVVKLDATVNVQK
jgi:type II secretory pathway component GspD/PulD (secretin)